MGDLLTRVSLDKSRENFIQVSEAMRKAFGEDVFSHAILHDMLEAPHDVAILDGVRRVQDIVALEPLPQFKLIAIDTEPQLRFERMKKRGEKTGETNMTWSEFQAVENAPTEVTIPEVMARAWRTIPNNGDMDAFVGSIHEMMRDLNISLKG